MIPPGQLTSVWRVHKQTFLSYSKSERSNSFDRSSFKVLVHDWWDSEGPQCREALEGHEAQWKAFIHEDKERFLVVSLLALT